MVGWLTNFISFICYYIGAFQPFWCWVRSSMREIIANQCIMNLPKSTCTIATDVIYSRKIEIIANHLEMYHQIRFAWKSVHEYLASIVCFSKFDKSNRTHIQTETHTYIDTHTHTHIYIYIYIYITESIRLCVLSYETEPITPTFYLN